MKRWCLLTDQLTSECLPNNEAFSGAAGQMPLPQPLYSVYFSLLSQYSCITQIYTHSVTQSVLVCLNVCVRIANNMRLIYPIICFIWAFYIQRGCTKTWTNKVHRYYYEVRHLCLSVCYWHISTLLHQIDWTLSRFAAEDPRRLSVETVQMNEAWFACSPSQVVSWESWCKQNGD